MPLYNHGPVVRRAIDSVLRQTCQWNEIIVVDDGSTDDGPEVVKSMIGSHVRLIQQTNQGVSSARNHGIEKARHELIALLDADDEWMPDHLETIVRLRNQFTECDVFATSYVYRSAGLADKPATLVGLANGASQFRLEDYFRIACGSDPPLCSSSVAAHRAAFQAIDGFPVGVSQGEDLLTWARLATHYAIAYAPRPSVAVWVEESSLRPKRVPPVLDIVGEQLHQLLGAVEPDRLPSLRRYLSLWHKMRGNMFLRLGDVLQSRLEFARALRFCSQDPRLWLWIVLSRLPSRLARRLLNLAASTKRSDGPTSNA